MCKLPMPSTQSGFHPLLKQVTDISAQRDTDENLEKIAHTHKCVDMPA